MDIKADWRFCSFGWVNASYIYGLQIVNAHMRRALGACTPYETFVKATQVGDDGLFPAAA